MRFKSAILVAAAGVFAAALLVRTPPPTTAGPVPYGFTICNVALEGEPVALATGDFNRDGNPDIAIADVENDAIIIFLTERDRFAAFDCEAAVTSSTIPVGEAPQAIAVGNLDSDTILDLAIATLDGVEILIGDGEGGFDEAIAADAGDNPASIAIGDVDGDGRADVVVGNGSGGSLTILYGDEFDELESGFLFVDGPATSVLVQDLDDDSFDDIAAVTSLGEVSIFLQDPTKDDRELRLGDGFKFFSIEAPAAIVARSLGIAPSIPNDPNDLNESIVFDTIPDLAIVGGGIDGVLAFHRGIADDLFEPFDPNQTAFIDAVGTNPVALAAGEFTGDANLDIFVANRGDGTLPLFAGGRTGTLVRVPGLCSLDPDICRGEDGPRALAVADIDGDGRDDLIVANQESASLTFLLSSRPTTPTPSPSFTPSRTRTETPTPTATAVPTQTLPPTPPTPTATAIVDCCRARPGEVGCVESTCSACVCNPDGGDPFCCGGDDGSGFWDQSCVDRARTACAAQCACPDFTATPGATDTPTAMPTETPTATPTATDTPTETPTGRTATPTFTITGTLPATVTPTQTPTVTETATITPTETRIPTQTLTPTSKCVGSIEPCVEGESCAIQPDGRRSSTGLLWIFLPGWVWFLARRLR